jgi:hypothetical protein
VWTFEKLLYEDGNFAARPSPMIFVAPGGTRPVRTTALPGIRSPARQPLQALAYGHCGKKFAEKLAGEVTHSPASGADTLTSV